jgi:hypothetical protein
MRRLYVAYRPLVINAVHGAPAIRVEAADTPSYSIPQTSNEAVTA